MWPIRLVVVVLPFEPVMPIVRPLRYGPASSTSPMTRTPAQERQVGRHVRREHDQVAAFEHRRRLLREGNAKPVEHFARLR